MKIQMIWSTTRSKQSLDLDSLTRISKERVRVSSAPNLTLIYFDGEIDSFDGIKPLYAQFHMLGLICRSIKLFTRGKLPKLEDCGFTHNGIFYVFAKSDIPIQAVPYGPDEWCMLIERRTGNGVPLRMLSSIPYFQAIPQQLELLG